MVIFPKRYTNLHMNNPITINMKTLTTIIFQ